MTTTLAESLAFVQALGVTVIRSEPDGLCTTYDDTRDVLTVCRNICPGRQGKVTDRLLRLASIQERAVELSEHISDQVPDRHAQGLRDSLDDVDRERPLPA